MGGEAKAAVETLHESYKLGGMPLVIVVVGFLTASGGSLLEGAEDFSSGISPILVFLIGALIVIFGAFMWLVEAKLKQDLQIAMIMAANSLIEGAGKASPDGANYQVALEKALPMIPKLFEAIDQSNNDSKRK